jgi:hypothetical protein
MGRGLSGLFTSGTSNEGVKMRPTPAVRRPRALDSEPALRAACERLESRFLFATITFDTVARVLTVETGGGEDWVTAHYSGGTRDITLSGDVDGTFTNVRRLNVRTGDARDQVRFITQSQPSKNFTLDVDCGGGSDEFVGGPGQFDITSGATFDMRINMGDGNDNTIADAGTTTNGCKVTAGSTLKMQLYGGTVFGIGDDKETASVFGYRGELDGTLLLDMTTDRGDDLLFAKVELLPDSTGSFGTAAAPARMNGGGESDTLDYRVFDNSGGTVDVFARMDGGFSLFDNDVGTHTANVVATGLESESIVTAFRDRSISQHTRAGDPVVLSGVVFEPTPARASSSTSIGATASPRPLSSPPVPSRPA